jgi:hypothetical protein
MVFDNPSEKGNIYTLRVFDIFLMIFEGARYLSKIETNCILQGFLMVFDGF